MALLLPTRPTHTILYTPYIEWCVCLLLLFSHDYLAVGKSVVYCTEMKKKKVVNDARLIGCCRHCQTPKWRCPSVACHLAIHRFFSAAPSLQEVNKSTSQTNSSVIFTSVGQQQQQQQKKTNNGGSTCLSCFLKINGVHVNLFTTTPFFFNLNFSI